MLKRKNKKETPEFDPYKIDRFAGIDPRIKIFFLKFWVVGASFYVVVYGLPQRFDYLDRMVVFWLILTLAIEYISNTIILWMHTDHTDTKKYLPHEINRKSMKSLMVTMLYVLIILVLTHYFIDTLTYYGIPTIGVFISESSIDPFTIAFVFLFFDYIWLRIRKTSSAIRRENNERK